MNYWRYLLPGWLVGLGLLAGHYKAVRAAPRQAPSPGPQVRVRAQAAQAPPKPHPTPKYVGYHRYRGTVLGRAAILELTTKWEADPGYYYCEGAYYYLNSGVSHPMLVDVFHPRQGRGPQANEPPLKLTTDD